MTSNQTDLAITIHSKIDREILNLDVAIYCGLIINELVTNSIKHAFTGRSVGTIDIQLRKMGDDFSLVVGDDGVSMHENISLNDSTRFGMQMLEIFVKQLRGKMEKERTNGTTFRITFK